MRTPASVVRLLLRAGYGLAGGLTLLMLVYAIGYLSQDHATLSEWYRSGGPFYRDAYWGEEFFTPRTKQIGNGLCVLALVGGGWLLFALLRSWRAGEKRPYRFIRGLPLERSDLRFLLLTALLQLGCWIYAAALLPPAYDEVFSALQVADRGVWRALSYYMLPNNHVFFNVLNALLFGWTDQLVLTGRIISLVAWWLLEVVLYVWVRTQTGGVRARPQVLSLLLLLPVWGFASQARGYSLLLLFSWLAFTGASTYLRDGKRGGLLLFSVSSVLAYATVPVFLYVHLALLLWMAGERRDTFRSLLRSHIQVGMAVFLFYLPILTFSGVGSLVGNRYVSAGGRGVVDFAGAFLPTLPDYANYVGLTLAGWLPWLLPLLLLLPLIAYPWLAPALRRPIRFYGILLGTTVATVLVMRAVPFHRALLFHFSYAVLLLLLIVARSRWWPLLWAVPLVLLLTVPRRFSLHLYYYDIVPTHRAARGLIDPIPAGARVYATDEAFYPAYLWRRGGGKLTDHPDGATHYLRGSGDPAPPAGFREVGSEVDVRLYER